MFVWVFCNVSFTARSIDGCAICRCLRQHFHFIIPYLHFHTPRRKQWHTYTGVEVWTHLEGVELYEQKVMSCNFNMKQTSNETQNMFYETFFNVLWNVNNYPSPDILVQVAVTLRISFRRKYWREDGHCFSPHEAMHSALHMRCPSVRPSVIFVYCLKTAKRILTLFHLLIRLINIMHNHTAVSNMISPKM